MKNERKMIKGHERAFNNIAKCEIGIARVKEDMRKAGLLEEYERILKEKLVKPMSLAKKNKAKW